MPQSRACPVTDLACTSNPTNVRSFPTEATRNLWLYRTSLSLLGNPLPIASEASGLLIPSNGLVRRVRMVHQHKARCTPQGSTLVPARACAPTCVLGSDDPCVVTGRGRSEPDRGDRKFWPHGPRGLGAPVPGHQNYFSCARSECGAGQRMVRDSRFMINCAHDSTGGGARCSRHE